MESGRLVVSDAGLAIGTWRNVFVNVWHRAGTVEALGRARVEMTNLLEREPAGFASLTLMEATSFKPTMTSEARAEANAVGRDFAPRTLAAAWIVTGPGLQMAAWRMVLSTMTLFARPRYPHETFAERTEGTRWLLSKLGAAGSREAEVRELVAFVDEVRSPRGGRR